MIDSGHSGQSVHWVSAKTLDWNFSDHFAVAVKRKKLREWHEKISFKGRSYKNYVKEDMQFVLLGFNWDAYY